MAVEVRRIQRLGNSSLVVVIPKEWARRLGLKPGDTVFLVDEGESIRVVPRSGEDRSAEAVVDASELGDLARHAVTCLYISGYSTVTLLSPGRARELVSHVRAQASKLIGVGVAEDNDRINVNVFLDDRRIDARASLRALASTTSALLELLSRATSKHLDEEAWRQAVLLRDEYVKHQHLIMRHLASRVTERGISESHYTALAAGYLNIIADIAFEILSLLREKGPLSGPAVKRLEGYSSALSQFVIVGTKLVLAPSAKRVREFMAGLDKLAERALEDAVSADNPLAAIAFFAVNRMAGIAKVLGYISICRGVEVAVLGGGRGGGGRRRL